MLLIDLGHDLVERLDLLRTAFSPVVHLGVRLQSRLWLLQRRDLADRDGLLLLRGRATSLVLLPRRLLSGPVFVLLHLHVFVDMLLLTHLTLVHHRRLVAQSFFLLRVPHLEHHRVGLLLVLGFEGSLDVVDLTVALARRQSVPILLLSLLLVLSLASQVAKDRRRPLSSLDRRAGLRLGELLVAVAVVDKQLHALVALLAVEHAPFAL